MATATTSEPVVAGNVYDKYGSRNPVAIWLMRGFLQSMENLVRRTNPDQIHEVGCGEGHLSSLMVDWLHVPVRGCDVSPEIIETAKRLHGDRARFDVKGIYNLQAGRDSANLIVCAEVLEHVDHPREALNVLAKLADPYCVLSVPREPLWRVLNVARGKYVGDLGNTPGHVQHWSRRAFCRLVSDYFEILEVRSPLPWTMLLCHSKRKSK